MVEKSRFDRVLDGVALRTGRVLGGLSNNFENTQPFNQPQMTPKERLYQYMTTDPRVKDAIRQQDPMGYRQHEEKMQQLYKEQGGQDGINNI